jgi:hypothetical protein
MRGKTKRTTGNPGEIGGRQRSQAGSTRRRQTAALTRTVLLAMGEVVAFRQLVPKSNMSQGMAKGTRQNATTTSVADRA